MALSTIDERLWSITKLKPIAVREVYLLVDPCDGAPRPCVLHSARPGPAEGGRPTPPTSSGTGVARLVSRFTSKLQLVETSQVQPRRENALQNVQTALAQQTLTQKFESTYLVSKRSNRINKRRQPNYYFFNYENVVKIYSGQ